MQLLDMVARRPAPEPWSEGDNIPWSEPEFSKRMLLEHLSQAHDAASRRAETIAAHVAWIHDQLLGGKPSRLLDLGCGPGLYANQLARLGHSCVGIDYSLASIAYAREQASAQGLANEFTLADIRHADYGQGYDLALLIYGELNVFCTSDAALILRKVRAALAPDGRLLLEPHTHDLLRAMGERPATWSTSSGGLFSDRPHLTLTESFWESSRNVATIRYFIIDAETGGVTRCAQSMQAYREQEYRALLHECGFGEVELYAGLGEDSGMLQKEFTAIVAHVMPVRKHE